MREPTLKGRAERGERVEERSGGGREAACMHPRLTAAAFLAPFVHVVAAFSAASMRAPAPALRARAAAASHFAASAFWHPQTRAPGGEGNMRRVVHASCGDGHRKFGVQWMLHQSDYGSAMSSRQRYRARQVRIATACGHFASEQEHVKIPLPHKHAGCTGNSGSTSAQHR